MTAGSAVDRTGPAVRRIVQPARGVAPRRLVAALCVLCAASSGAAVANRGAAVPTLFETQRIPAQDHASLGLAAQFGATLAASGRHAAIGALGRVYAATQQPGPENWHVFLEDDFSAGTGVAAVANHRWIFGTDRDVPATVWAASWPTGQTWPGSPASLPELHRGLRSLALGGTHAYVGVNFPEPDGHVGRINLWLESQGNWSFAGAILGGDCTFGRALAVSSDGALLLQGAECPGEGYVDVRQTGSPLSSEFSATRSGSFGASVAFSGTDFVAGAPELVVLGQGERGGVYPYRRTGPTTWQAQSPLLGTQNQAAFGAAVAADETTLVVGAPLENFGSPFTILDRGAAYVYRKCNGSWRPLAKLLGSQTGMDSRFGSAVAITDRGVLVGAPGDDGPMGEPGAGAVYYFHGLVPLHTACFEGGDTSEWSSTSP